MTSQNSLFGNGLFDNLANLFEEDPLGQRALFQGRLNEGNFNPQQQSALGTQFDNTFGKYLGQLGQQIRQGQVPGPQDTFNNFLNDYNPQRDLLRTQGLGGGGFGATRFNFGS